MHPRPTPRPSDHRPLRPAAGLAAALALALGATPQPARAQVVLRDDFDGAQLDPSVWCVPTGVGSYFGRTQIRPLPPELRGGLAHFVLATYNPDALVAGDSFHGTEIETLEVYPLAQGLRFKARLRIVPTGLDAADTPIPLSCGIVGALFSFTDNDCGQQGLDVRDEIDFELLTNEIVAGTDRVLTNTFQSRPFSNPGAFAYVTPGIDLTDFHEYEVRWSPGRIEWWIDHRLQRVETTEVPQDPQTVRLNLWAPADTFADAFCAALQPVDNAADNLRYFSEVDFVEIRRCETITLDASPEHPRPGDELGLILCGGLPDARALLLSLDLNGVPFVSILGRSSLDTRGEWDFSNPVPSGLSGLSLGVVGFARDASGRYRDSNVERVSFQ